MVKEAQGGAGLLLFTVRRRRRVFIPVFSPQKKGVTGVAQATMIVVVHPC
jgi:hypothetical protein